MIDFPAFFATFHTAVFPIVITVFLAALFCHFCICMEKRHEATASTEWSAFASFLLTGVLALFFVAGGTLVDPGFLVFIDLVIVVASSIVAITRWMEAVAALNAPEKAG